MDYITITEEDILNANDYVPLSKKSEFVAYAAQRCFERIEMSASQNDDSTTQLPAMYKENSILKSRYLMGALVKMYLKKDYEPIGGDDWLMSQDDYDRYAGGHILNQIERMKQKGGNVRNIAFDLLQDYHDIEKKLNAEIYGLMQPMNDVVARLVAYVNDAMAEAVKSGAMKRTAEEIEQLKDEIAEYKEKHSRKGE